MCVCVRVQDHPVLLSRLINVNLSSQAGTFNAEAGGDSMDRRATSPSGSGKERGGWDEVERVGDGHRPADRLNFRGQASRRTSRCLRGAAARPGRTPPSDSIEIRDFSFDRQCRIFS